MVKRKRLESLIESSGSRELKRSNPKSIKTSKIKEAISGYLLSDSRIVEQHEKLYDAILPFTPGSSFAQSSYKRYCKPLDDALFKKFLASMFILNSRYSN